MIYGLAPSNSDSTVLPRSASDFKSAEILRLSALQVSIEKLLTEPFSFWTQRAANNDETARKFVVQGRRLIEESGAKVLILGCAGMATHRHEAEKTLGIRVIVIDRASIFTQRTVTTM